ncbi:MAG: glycosyltransferase family 2 protein [Gemmatimonas sp.]
MPSVPMLSVVVPVKNEQENIFPLLEEIHAALDGKADFEVIYVDDGSTDATGQRLMEAKQRFTRLRIVRHKLSCGQSRAVASGVHAARGDWIVTLDGDGQNDPADIPKLLAHVETADKVVPVNLVAGIRRKREDSAVKRISSKLANAIRQRLLHDGVSDTGCGLKAIRREAFLRLPYFDHMHRYLPALIRRDGGAVETVQVNHRPRLRGASNYGFFDRLWVGISDLVGVMWLMRRCKKPIYDAES